MGTLAGSVPCRTAYQADDPSMRVCSPLNCHTTVHAPWHCIGSCDADISHMYRHWRKAHGRQSHAQRSAHCGRIGGMQPRPRNEHHLP